MISMTPKHFTASVSLPSCMKEHFLEATGCVSDGAPLLRINRGVLFDYFLFYFKVAIINIDNYNPSK